MRRLIHLAVGVGLVLGGPRAAGAFNCEMPLARANTELILFFLYKNTRPDYLTKVGVNMSFVDLARRLSAPEDVARTMERLAAVGFKKTDYPMLTGYEDFPKARERLFAGWRVVSRPWVSRSALDTTLLRSKELERVDHRLRSRGLVPEQDWTRDWKNVVWLLMLDEPILNPEGTRNMFAQTRTLLRYGSYAYDAEAKALEVKWRSFSGEIADRARRTEIGQVIDEIARLVAEGPLAR